MQNRRLLPSCPFGGQDVDIAPRSVCPSGISAVKPRFRALAENRSSRSVAGSRAMSSMIHQFPFRLNDLADHCPDPVGCVPCIPEEFFQLVGRQGPPQLR